MNDRPRDRVSLTEKMNRKWYMNNAHYWIDFALNSNDKDEVLHNINAANGVVDKDTYNYVLTPLAASEDNKKLPGVIRNTDFITPIREKNIGEYLELPHSFMVKVDDPNISLLRKFEVGNQIRPILEQELANKISQDEQSGIPQTNPEDIKTIADDVTEKWFDTRAMNAQHLVQWIADNNRIEEQRLSGFNDWWSTEHCFFRVFEANGEPLFEQISSLEGFPVGNGYEYTDDQEAFVIIRKLSIDRINEYYGDRLSEKDRKYLDTLFETTGSSYSVPVSLYTNIYGNIDFPKDSTGMSTSFNDVNAIFSNSRQVDEYIIYFKTQVQRKILYKANQFGEIVTEVVENEKDFVFDEEQGHIKLETEWITETWEQVQLGQRYSGIYLKPQPVLVQVYDALGHNKIPIIGKKGLLNGVFINPIPKRIIPNLALHRIITLQIERQMAKFKGAIEIIPKSMLADGTGSTKANMFYKMADNTIIYDDSEVDWNVISQGYKIVGNDAISGYIKTLIDFRDIIKAEAWDMANMNDGRYGQAPASSTVTNNKDNIYRAKLGSVLMITVYNTILLRLYTMLLEYGKVTYVDGKSGGLFDKAERDIKYFNIDDGELTANNYGLFMSNSVVDYNKLSEYKDLAFSAAQNGEFDIAAEAIDSDNVAQIRKGIKKLIKAEKEFKQQMEQQQLEQQKQIHTEILEDKQADRQNELDRIELKEQMITDRETALAAMDTNDNVTINK
jgi:hypothetical protein